MVRVCVRVCVVAAAALAVALAAAALAAALALAVAPTQALSHSGVFGIGSWVSYVFFGFVGFLPISQHFL